MYYFSMRGRPRKYFSPGEALKGRNELARKRRENLSEEDLLILRKKQAERMYFVNWKLLWYSDIKLNIIV